MWVLDPGSTGVGIVVDIASRPLKKNGEPGKPQPLRIACAAVPRIASPLDREILSLTASAGYHRNGARARHGLPVPGAAATLERIVVPSLLIVLFVYTMNLQGGVPLPVIIVLAVAIVGTS
jgi:ABC-type xylose transport system permease subunit